jgi:hypothetical protein
VAYYALLSIVPLLILTVIALTHVIDQQELLGTVGRYLEWLVPSQSTAVVKELSNFLANRNQIGWVLFATMLFFRLARLHGARERDVGDLRAPVVAKKRRFIFSVLIPYVYILCLGIGLPAR